MAAALNCSLLPNPFTPDEFLPPDVAHQFQTATYVLVGTMGAYVWISLSNVVDDYKFVTTTKVSIGTVAYFLSRISTFGYIFGTTLFQTYPLKRCHFALQFAQTLFVVANPVTSLLFFLRAWAIFDRDPYFVCFFFCAWLSVLGAAITVPIGVKGGNIGPTDFCVEVSAAKYIGGANVTTTTFHDTFIFLAISWRLFKHSHLDPGIKKNFRAFVTGKYLPQFSRAVLQDGQLYYLITITSNLLTLIMFYATSLEESTMFPVPNLMVANVMACHVFRKTKLGLQRRVVTTSEIKTRDTSSVIFMNTRNLNLASRVKIEHPD
ncbi:hypothetical protein GGX14DRAFT_660103 [Mycena pura]|uniref:Transmembrane protein n=1 Tax=Mycena pura TaxID=153505 RepID=A0AAD6V444_9AGAR|nr:hypothetical protein GGX14DRAFT_660103 [Mycena pura]